MKTVRFNYPHPSGGYGCSKPGEQSGEFVRADVARELLANLRGVLELAVLKWGNLDPDANKVFEEAREAIRKATGK